MNTNKTNGVSESDSQMNVTKSLPLTFIDKSKTNLYNLEIFYVVNLVSARLSNWFGFSLFRVPAIPYFSLIQ